MDKNIKYVVTDYVTPAEACKIIGISERSTPLITRWINEGRIKGVLNFGNNKAIPVNWVMSECNSRGINWEGVKLEPGQIAVSLEDFMPIVEYAKENNLNYSTFHSTFRRGTFKGDWIKFGNSFGIRK